MLSTIKADNIKSPVRKVKGAVAVYRAATLLKTYTYQDDLKEFTLERISEGSKFFGYGVAQRVNVKFRDTQRANPVLPGDIFTLSLDCNDADTYAFTSGKYYVSERRRDENTNELSVFAYDKLKDATEHYTSEVDFSSCETFYAYMVAIKDFLGLDGLVLKDFPLADAQSAAKADLEGSETLRGLLDDLAEATQTIYYINCENKLVFRRLSKSGEDLVLNKDDYTALKSGDNRRLQTICAATQFGNNVSASTSSVGTTQYIRDNDFWNTDDNIQSAVDTALALYGDFSINQFNVTWRGDYRLEVGDRLKIEQKDGTYVYSFLVDDKLAYNGFFQQVSKWEYQDNEGETASNPTSLGDKLKQTYAIVDKTNKEIDMVVSKIDEVDNKVTSMKLNVDGISARVTQVSEDTKRQTDALNNNITQIMEDNEQAQETIYAEMDKIQKSVNAAITADQLAIEVAKQISNGVNEVTTTTGFTFNQEGLRVAKSQSEMETLITDDGMKIYRNNQEVLTANNKGVDALNLHATTYLIVGKYSRFEDYDSRTGCFWLGDSGLDTIQSDIQEVNEVT